MDNERVPVLVHHERYDTCRNCDQSEIIEPDLVCKVCGCLLLGMTRLKDYECPLGKWGKFQDQ